MGTREAIDDAVRREEGAEGGVDEFATVVTLHALDNSVKLGVNVGKKALKNRGGLGLMAKRKRPRVVRVVIEDDEVVGITGKTHNK